MDSEQDGAELGKRLSQSGKANALMVMISLGFLLVAFSYPRFAARGQSYGMSPGITIPILPPAIVTPPVVVPTDVTNPQIINPHATKIPPGAALPQTQAGMALAGIRQLNDKDFPGINKVGKNFDWITVLAKEGAVYTKPNSYTADLKSGDIIVSVKSPSHLAFAKTPYGDIAIGANSDVMISYNQGVLRLLNFDGEGQVLKIKLDRGPFGGPADPTVTIAPGYELIASDKVITRNDLRPRDGIKRRFAKTLENGHLAISEFSLVSAANNIGMLVNLQQTTTGIKERRIVSDLSKMAAIINYRNGDRGDDGYTAEK